MKMVKLKKFWLDSSKDKYHAIIELEPGSFVCLKEYTRGLEIEKYKASARAHSSKKRAWPGRILGFGKILYETVKRDPKTAFFAVIATIIILAVIMGAVK